MLLSLWGCDEPMGCTLVGCGGIFTASSGPRFTAAQITNCTLKLCFNSQCSTATFGAPGSFATGDGKLIASFGADSFGQYALQVMLDDENADHAVNGDHYLLTLTAADGTVIFDQQYTAYYDAYYPNGMRCDKVACLSYHADI